MQPQKKSLHPALKLVAMVAALGAGFWTRESMETSKLTVQPSVSLSNKDSEPNSQTLASLKESNVPESQLFLQILELLEANFVNGVDDPMDVAAGSVRGMVNRLMDPDAIFLGKEEFTAMQAIREGKLEGIGAELYFKYDRAEIKKYKKFQQDLAAKKVKIEDADTAFSQARLIPDLIVRAVAPGSPAEKAGLKPGDRIEKIDSRWVYSASWLDELTKLSNKIRDGKLSPAEVTTIRKQVKEQADNNMVPARAFDELSINQKIIDKTTEKTVDKTKASSTLKVSWRSPGVTGTKTVSINKIVTTIKPLTKLSNGEYALQFLPGAADALRKELEQNQAITLNLENTVYGDIDRMKECLAVVMPNGNYGNIRTAKGNEKFEISGANKGALLTIKANAFIEGPAKIFATVFATAFSNQVSGLPKNNEPVTLTKLIKLPNGSGYTLPYGEFTLVSGGSK